MSKAYAQRFMFQVLTDFEKKKKMAKKLMGMKEDAAPKAARQKSKPLYSSIETRGRRILPLFFRMPSSIENRIDSRDMI